MAGYRKFFRQWQRESEKLQRIEWAKQTARLRWLQTKRDMLTEIVEKNAEEIRDLRLF